MFYSVRRTGEEGVMRWENLTGESEHGRAGSALFGAEAVTTRAFDTTELRGITCHEVRARSVLNRMPGAGSRVPRGGSSSGPSIPAVAARTRACTSLDDP